MEPEQGKMYLVNIGRETKECIYIGKKKIKSSIEHLFLVKERNKNLNEKTEEPRIFDYDFGLMRTKEVNVNENKLEIKELHYLRKLKEKEEKYLTWLGKKYWVQSGQDL